MFGNGEGAIVGPFDCISRTVPRSLAIGDFNGDARPDLAVANFRQEPPLGVSVLLNGAASAFIPTMSTAAFIVLLLALAMIALTKL